MPTWPPHQLPDYQLRAQHDVVVGERLLSLSLSRQADRGASELFVGHPNGGERGGQIGSERHVVEPDQGNAGGHGQTRLTQRGQSADGNHVGAGEDRREVQPLVQRGPGPLIAGNPGV
jgi:hypothetical protein